MHSFTAPSPTTSPRTRLREAHAHIPAHGRALRMLDLSGCTSREQFLDLIEQHSQALGSDLGQDPGARSWLLAQGARVEGWVEPQWPNLVEFDRVTGNRPACAMSFDYHCVLANTAAMRAAGFREDSPDPAGGVICRDARTSRPTGVLLESAATRVWNAAPEQTLAECRQNVAVALRDLAGHG